MKKLTLNQLAVLKSEERLAQPNRFIKQIIKITVALCLDYTNQKTRLEIKFQLVGKWNNVIG